MHCCKNRHLNTLIASTVPFVVRFILVIGFVAFLDQKLFSGEGVQIGDASPNFSLHDLNGQKTNLSDYKGFVVVLDFWATWCGPCKRSIPDLVNLNNKFRGKKFVVFGISTDRAAGIQQIKEFAGRYNVEYTILRDYDGDASRSYRISGIPAFFIIDQSGKIVKKYVGYDPKMKQEWITDISNLLAMEKNNDSVTVSKVETKPNTILKEIPEGSSDQGITIFADAGAILTSRIIKITDSKIGNNTLCYTIRYVVPRGKKGEWGKNFGGPDASQFQKVIFRVRSNTGKDDLSIGLKDALQKEFFIPVNLRDKEWHEFSFPLNETNSIDNESIAQFFVRFSTRGGSGTIFLENPHLEGRNTAKKIISKKTKELPQKKEGMKKMEAEKPKSKIKPVITSLIKDFKRTPEDLKAVSDMLLESVRKDPPTSQGMGDEEFMDLIQQRAFLFFWYESNPENGVTLDRGRCFEPTGHDTASNASVGFLLTALGIAHSHGWITYEQAYDRVLKTLKFHKDKIENVHGFFYHWQEIKDGSKKVSWRSEISTIDTALCMAGIIFVMEYFKGTEIEKIAEELYLRVDWNWAHNGQKFCSMGVDFGGKVIGDSWNRYCEGLLLSVFELGHPTANIDKASWFDIAKAQGSYKGFKCISQTGPLFGYQYPHCWIDFRHKNDGWANHFEISVNETLANRQYAIDLMGQRKGYGPNSWGFTASDHPGGYHPFAAPPGPPGENGTIAPTGPGGSFVFTPYFSLKAFRYMYDTWKEKIWGKYGFVDAYNIEKNWFDPDNIGIDQGPILLMIENHRTGLVWEYMMRNKYVQAGMKKIGFVDEPRATAKVLPLDLSGEDWRVKRGDQSAWSQPNYDDSQWQKIYVPDKWENQFSEPYDGSGWYRKHFKITQQTFQSWQGMELVLHMGAVDDEDETYLNGQKIGSSTGWESKRVYKVDPKLLKIGDENVLAVKVKDTTGEGGLWMRPVEIGPYLPIDWKPFRQ